MAYPGGRKVQTSTPPDLTRVRPSVNTDRKSASNNVPRTDTEGQQNIMAGGEPQNPVPLGPYRGPPRGQQGAVERQPLRRPKEALTQPQNSLALGPYHGPPRGEQGFVEQQPSRMPKEASLQLGVPQPSLQLGVPQPLRPQSPRPRPQFTPPLTLFQDSWAALNDYCGTLIAKMNVDYHHEFPFYMRAAYETDCATIWNVYSAVVRVLDYMTYVVKQFGTPREKMVDLAEAFIKTLSEILQMLRHEGIPEGKTWNVEVQEMVDFLVNPDNKNHLTVGKKQIQCLHNSLSHCALHALSSSRH